MHRAETLPAVMCNGGGLPLCGIVVVVVVATMWLSNLNFNIVRRNV